MSAEAQYMWSEGRWCIKINDKWYSVYLKMINDRPVITFSDPKDKKKTFPLKEILVY